jgi:thymidylate kinase
MITVALVGPDGAGKTTVCRQLETSLPFPTKYLYMGINLDSSNRMAPTSRLLRLLKGKGHQEHHSSTPPAARRTSKNPLRRAMRGLRSIISLSLRLLDEWFRQFLVWSYGARGYLVLFDRHYFTDFYFSDVAVTSAKRTLARRLHGFLLKHCYPRPKLVIYLDAPSDVLFARKHEGTLESLECKRQQYLSLSSEFENFNVINSHQPLENVVSEVASLIIAFCHGGQPSKVLVSAHES